MKSVVKKVVSLALVAGMALSSVACGNSNTATTSNSGSATNTTSDALVWKIGSTGPLTGGAAVYGTNVVNSAKLACDEINAAGGINGYQIEFNGQDDEADAEKAVNAYNTLKDWGMQLFVGTTTSGACVATVAKTSADNMFQVTPSASSTDVVNGNTNVYQICFTDPNQGIASAQYIGENALATKVAVIYDSSDVYSTGIYEKFAEEAANQSFEIVSVGAFTADNKTDFSVQLQDAKNNGADLVFLPIYYNEAALILNQAKTLGYDVQFFGCDGLDGILSVENFDKSLAEGVLLLTPFVATSTDEKTVAFVEAYKKAYNGEVPNQFGADAYDAVYLLKAMIESGNLTPDMSTSDICEALKKEIVKISFDGVTGAAMTWVESGEVSKSPKAMVIKNGEYVPFEK
ncbi:MAG: ABC transporter substrate-binding protein [Lachnospiraceae bacterium]|nr:ABC transporter substrate-binding protein [Lachnospiraceae bacterium]